VQIVDDRILCFDPRDPDASRSFCERGFLPPGTKRYKDKRFMFDRVFNNEADQTDVYESTAKPLLTPLLDGFNATIFAYGVRDNHLYLLIPLIEAYRQPAVARRTRSAGLKPLLGSFILLWPTSSNVSKIEGTNITWRL
jgi:hypothetical protein